MPVVQRVSQAINAVVEKFLFVIGAAIAIFVVHVLADMARTLERKTP